MIVQYKIFNPWTSFSVNNNVRCHIVSPLPCIKQFILNHRLRNQSKHMHLFFTHLHWKWRKKDRKKMEEPMFLNWNFRLLVFWIWSLYKFYFLVWSPSPCDSSPTLRNQPYLPHHPLPRHHLFATFTFL